MEAYSDTLGEAAKTRRKCEKPRLSQDHLMHTRCPAIYATCDEKKKKEGRRKRPIVARQVIRSWVPLFLPHKPGVIAYAGMAVARM
jgi:hypothetical protein